MFKGRDVSFEELLQLEAHVKRRLDGRVRQLHLSLQDSGIILRGTSTSYYGKQLAQHAAMELTELPILANEIQVE
ncbi:MAG TPA: hypothetical protein VHC19_17315 [Pirellulales bacterium]|nr:hypothetical protein [Pirellulales bacterium]